MTAALSDLRVVEMGQLLAGPFCGQLLADFGADVIKLEPPGQGDPMREWGREKADGRSLWWPVVARGKRSVTINLREKDGQVVAVGLASATPSGDTRLSSITVDAAYRGRGLGWAVTQALTEVGFARSAAVVLGVERSNPAGQGLYAAIGFRRVHEFVSAILPSAIS